MNYLQSLETNYTIWSRAINPIFQAVNTSELVVASFSSLATAVCAMNRYFSRLVGNELYILQANIRLFAIE